MAYFRVAPVVRSRCSQVAAAVGGEAAAARLLQAEADVDARTADGRSSLHIALAAQHRACAWVRAEKSCLVLGGSLGYVG